MSEPDSTFVLHERLAADTAPVGDLSLSRVLLIDDARFPWILLVPRRAGIREIIDLEEPEQAILFREIAAASRAMRSLFSPDKLNVAAIGNVVPQLHVHVIARFTRDEAWPKPTFGFGQAVPYAAAERGALVRRISRALGGLGPFAEAAA
jgi:diadenosine tetraphosphate (Ap4A) HIT family hydrolase